MIHRPVVLATLLAARAVLAAEPAIVPRPVSVEECAGTFVLRSDSVLVADRITAGEARRLAETLGPALGAVPRVVTTRQVSEVRRRLGLCPKALRKSNRCHTWLRFARTRSRRIPDEGYEL